MDIIKSIILELERIHKVKIDYKLFQSSKIYTTKEYIDKFEKKWGYSANGIGILLAEKDWDLIKKLLKIPKHLRAIEYLPNECDMPNGFVLIKKNKDYANWNLDHELLHFAHYENSKGFRKLLKKFDSTKPDKKMLVKRIEAEFLYEICAFRDNVIVASDKLDFNWIKSYLNEKYLPYELNKLSKKYNISLENEKEYFIENINLIVDLVKKKFDLNAQKEITKIFFNLKYEEPFKEAIHDFS